MSAIEIHFPQASRAQAHIRTTREGLDQLKQAIGEADIDKVISVGSIGRFSGMPVYVDECPCDRKKDEAHVPEDMPGLPE